MLDNIFYKNLSNLIIYYHQHGSPEKDKKKFKIESDIARQMICQVKDLNLAVQRSDELRGKRG